MTIYRNDTKLLLKIIRAKFGQKNDTELILNWLIESGILNRRDLVRFLVKYEFYQRIKNKNRKLKLLHIKMDLAAEYNISLETVNKIMYKYMEIKV